MFIDNDMQMLPRQLLYHSKVKLFSHSGGPLLAHGGSTHFFYFISIAEIAD